MPVEDMAVGQIKYKNGLRAIVELGEFAPQISNFTYSVLMTSTPRWLMLLYIVKGWFSAKGFILYLLHNSQGM